MSPLLDRFGQLVDEVLGPRDEPAWERLGARATSVVQLGPFIAVVRWRNR